MSTLLANKSLGSVLVVGGCGFVGFHIVRHLLEDQFCTSVAIQSRNPPEPQQACGRVLSCWRYYLPETIQSLLAEIQPTVIIHSTSPIPFGNDADEAHFYSINVKGTKTLLECAAVVPLVTALIYTSSVTVMADTAFISLKTAPIHNVTSRASYYSKTKAIADASVLAANNPPNRRTSCLRLVAVYGERENQVIPGGLAEFRQCRQRF